MAISTQTAAQKTADQIISDNADLLARQARVLDVGYNRFWSDPVNIAAALTARGINVGLLLLLHAQLNATRVEICLNDGLPVNFPGIRLAAPTSDPTQAASYVPCIPPGWTYTVNADGSLAIVQTSGG